MPRALVYLRVSTDKQDVRAQVDACNDWCARNGYDVVGPFEEDAGLSGATPLERCPALTDLMGEIGKGDVLLVQKRDRLARDRNKIFQMELHLKKRRARLVSAAGEGTEIEDPLDPTGLLMRGIFDLFAEFERAQTAWRTRGKLATKKKAGERTGGLPYGKRLVDDGRRSRARTVKRADGTTEVRGGLPIALADDPGELRTLAHVHRLRRAGWAYGRIAWALNRAGLLNRGGRPWGKSTIHYLCVSHGVTKGTSDEHTDPPAPDAGPRDAP